ncbi:MAG: hypothetical protein EA391_05020 [Balneolaceae bacterium]|nr:MAG: hypothetical protein EA391_05020 [Balneolaceae bacterium]
MNKSLTKKHGLNVTEFQKNTTKLFNDFSPSTKKDWEKIVLEDIGPEHDLSKISWNLPGMQPALPLYTKEEISYSETNPIRKTCSWQLCDYISDKNFSDAKNSIIEAANGGSECCFISKKVDIDFEEDFKNLIKAAENAGVDLIFESLKISKFTDSADDIDSNVTFLRDDFSDSSQSNLNSFEIKPLSSNQLLSVNGSNYCSDEASIPHRLAVSLSIASEYLLATDLKAADSILFRVNTGSLYFPEIAKLRALRVLWHNMMEAWKVSGNPETLILSEIEKNDATDSPYNNLLISVTEAMSAVLGGTDILMIHPFDNENHFSGRITRNIHHILNEEAHFGKVADPAAGSYYVEKLTDEIAKEAWRRFGQIEENGGFLNSLENGIIPEDLL